MKIAILSMVNATFREYGEDAISLFMPLHITDWEEVDDGTFWRIKEGIRIMNESPENKKNGMSYRMFTDNGGTKDLIIKSVSAYDEMVKAQAKRKQDQKERADREREAKKMSQALNKKAKTLKDAISTMELTGGNKAVLEGLRRELESIKPSKKVKT